jgi:hypothetical protein
LAGYITLAYIFQWRGRGSLLFILFLPAFGAPREKGGESQHHRDKYLEQQQTEKLESE